MGNFTFLMQGFSTALSIENLLLALFGGFLGILVGAMPGLGSATGISLLLPLTFKMNPISGIIMLAGIYYGNMFGGAYSAILLNIPGDSPAVCTAIDGYPLARKGKSGKALASANTASLIGGILGILFLTIAGPALAEVGLKFGPTEIAALIFFALTSIGWLLGDNPKKCLISTGLGLMLAMIGMDPASGQIRYTFGTFSLLSGLQFVPLVIGMFGFSQVIDCMVRKDEVDTTKLTKISLKESRLDWKELKSIIPVSVRSGLVGNFIGFLPGAGGTTSAFLCYVLEKKIGKRGKYLGTGEITGVAASESANNAASIGSFVPLLGLGIPGSTTSAVLLGALMMWGLKPGPLLFSSEPDFVWALIASMYIGNLLCFLIGMSSIPALSSILKISSKTLAPIIMVICILGSYSASYNIFDVWTMIIAGLLSFYMQTNSFPVAPLLLAFVLGSKLETAIRQAMGISRGDVTIFIRRPISAVILALTLAMVLFPVIRGFISSKKKENTREL